MGRKTFDVQVVKAQVNDYLKNSPDKHDERRVGKIVLMESILMATNNYRGFGYLNSHDMGDSNTGTTVGINSPKSGQTFSDMTWEERFDATDDTRRFYF